MAFRYDVVEKVGTINNRSDGTNVELRLISWNNNTPKYDLRGWWDNEDGTEGMSKGISLTSDELVSLKKLLNSIDLGEENG